MGTVTPKIVWIFLDICRFTTSLFFSFFLAPEWRGYWHVFSGRQLRPRLYLWFGQIHMHSCWCVGKSNFPTLISIRSCSSTFPTSLERWQLCKWPAMSSLHSNNLRTANDEPRKSPQLDFRNSENEHFASIANLSITSMMCYSRGDWELKTPVENTKWPLHLWNLPWIPGSPFTVYTCMCAESCPKKCFYKPFKRTRHD